MYANNCWYVIATSEEVGRDAPVAGELAGLPIVLYRRGDGTPVALDNRCAHRLAPLSLGRIEGDRIRCMYHGICYDADGACVEVPGQATVPAAFAQRRFPLVERHGWLWAWLGEEEADEALLPPTGSLDPKAWHVRRGDLTYAADYQLINDNLCDLSHAAYVHSATFGQIGGDQWATRQPSIVAVDRGFRIDRWLLDTAAPSSLQGPVDAWLSYDFLLPGIFLLTTIFFPGGTGERVGMGRPDDTPPLHTSISLQAVTPLGPNRSRYFFSASVPRHEDERHADFLFGMTLAAFDEDKTMIEAQQAMIAMTPEPRLAATRHDEAAVRFRRLIEATRRNRAPAAAEAEARRPAVLVD